METNAFENLPNLKEIIISPKTLKLNETETFTNLPKLVSLDLSNQLITKLPQNFTSGYVILILLIIFEKTYSIRNFTSLIKINLGHNQLEEIEDDVFENFPQLLNLNLTGNKIHSLGNNLGLLNNTDTEIDLSNNDITFLFGMVRVHSLD